MAVFRSFIDSDAPEIIGAVRESYGEEYSPKFMYDEDILRMANLSGKLKFTVAETESGEFMGVIGLKIVDYFLGTVEVIALIIREKFRKANIGFELFNKCMLVADEMNIPSVYGSAAVINDFSQRIMSKLGYVATGFWLNRKFFSRELSGEKNFKSEKVNMIVMVRNNNVSDVGVLYLPKPYAAIASDCYEEFKVKFEFCSVIESPSVYQTVFTQSSEDDYFNTNLFVYNAGNDFNNILKKNSLLENKLSTVSVFIDMKNKSAVWATGQLESFGYKLTGFLPLASGHEYAIFHLCRCGVYFDEFAICEQFNKIRKKFN